MRVKLEIKKVSLVTFPLSKMYSCIRRLNIVLIKVKAINIVFMSGAGLEYILYRSFESKSNSDYWLDSSATMQTSNSPLFIKIRLHCLGLYHTRFLINVTIKLNIPGYVFRKLGWVRNKESNFEVKHVRRRTLKIETNKH